MADSQARLIIEDALALLRSDAHAPALDILDQAMQGRHGSDPEFDVLGEDGFSDWIVPSSPFGELLRRAFAPELGQGAAVRWLADDTVILIEWQEQVIAPFAERYRLWGFER